MHKEYIILGKIKKHNIFLNFVIFSTFIEFAGRFGPTAIAVSQSERLYVARYEFSNVSTDGIITVVDNTGVIRDNIIIPGAPEINGLSFSK